MCVRNFWSRVHVHSLACNLRFLCRSSLAPGAVPEDMAGDTGDGNRVEAICQAGGLSAGFALGLVLASLHRENARACVWTTAGFTAFCAAQWLFRRTLASDRGRFTAPILFNLSVGVVAGVGVACFESAWHARERESARAVECVTQVNLSVFSGLDPAVECRDSKPKHVHLNGQEECAECGYVLKRPRPSRPQNASPRLY